MVVIRVRAKTGRYTGWSVGRVRCVSETVIPVGVLLDHCPPVQE